MAMGRDVGLGDVAEPSEHDADGNRSGERIGERISEVPTVGKSPPVECGRNRRRRRQRARRNFFRRKRAEVEESGIRDRGYAPGSTDRSSVESACTAGRRGSTRSAGSRGDPP